MAAPVSPRAPTERSIETRRRILDATVACLISSGHAQTSTLAVQARAGVSRGALLHHFPSRAELLAATVEHLFTLTSAQITTMSTRSTRRVEAAVAMLWNSTLSPLATAVQELWTAARTDDELRQALLRYESDLDARLLATCAQLFGPDLVAHPHYESAVRVLVHAMRGAAQLRSLHPERSTKTDLDLFTTTMQSLLA